jgi:hypothetical protein
MLSKHLFWRFAALRVGLRRKEGISLRFYGTTPQALLAVARVSLGAQVVP